MSKTKTLTNEDDDDVRFPRVKMPKLHCFNLQIGSTKEENIDTQEDKDRRLREKERWLFRKRLQKMSQLAVSNAASAKRIMEKPTFDELTALDYFDIDELIDVDYFILGKNHSLRDDSAHITPYTPILQLEESSQKSRESPVEGGDFVEEISECKSVQNPSREISAKSKTSSKKSVKFSDDLPVSESRSTPVESESESESRLSVAPLSMSDILPNAKIMEPKPLYTLWTNFASCSD